MKEKTGILGGTFDPVHLGHIQLARYAMEMCGLDRVIFVPAFHPPHKKLSSLTPFRYRIEMLEMAIENEENLFVSAVEENIPAPTYTIDMLSCFLQQDNENEEFYFIIGIDAFLEIPSWKDFLLLIQKTHFIVSARKGYDVAEMHDLLGQLGYKQVSHNQYRNVSHCVFYLDEEIVGISSSEIRQGIRSASIKDDLLLPGIKQYIDRNNIYR